MRWIALAAVSTLALGTMAGAAPPRTVVEKSPDLLRPQQLRKVTPLELNAGLTAAAAPTAADVGDPDSFGRYVTYLGLAQTQPVLVTADCSTSDPKFERCIVGNPAPSITAFNESDLAVMKLPAKATQSLLCFTLTPVVQLNWFNPLASPATARFSANAVLTIENPVLDDPALIDPTTGLPFGGQMQLGLSTYIDSHTLAPGAQDNKLLFLSRGCIAGVVNKRSLVESYGLTEAQATNFFRKPMTIRFGSRGNVALAEFASYFYGIRFYGD